jgi:DNA end-binding protein Ku
MCSQTHKFIRVSTRPDVTKTGRGNLGGVGELSQIETPRDRQISEVSRMPRSIWSGAISFGLVYIPVQLHSASQSSHLDLDFLDKRDFSPVGYQRINKRTGKVVEWKDIVKGYQYQKGEYVALSDEDFRQANVKATQTIDIAQFTELENISPEYFETPYFLSPGKGGAKVYALLRDALKSSKKAAIATFVMRGRQHLAMVHASGKALMLNTLRFAEEIREPKDLDLPAASGVTSKEAAMAERLIDEMTDKWNPSQFTDTYSKDLLARVKEKIKNKETHTLTAAEKSREPRKTAQVIDLMEVLKKSLEQGKGARRATGTTQASSKRAPARRRRATRTRTRRRA